jgi:hypothetical protein
MDTSAFGPSRPMPKRSQVTKTLYLKITYAGSGLGLLSCLSDHTSICESNFESVIHGKKTMKKIRGVRRWVFDGVEDGRSKTVSGVAASPLLSARKKDLRKTFDQILKSDF